MNVTDNYMLQQMQNMAASMTGVPQLGKNNKTAEGSSFQDLMDQAGKTNNNNTESTPAKDTKETGTKGPVKEKAEDAEAQEKVPVKTEEKEELKPEQLAANPNAVSILDLFRPDVVQPVEEPVIEVPVDAVAEEGVEAADLALDGQFSGMETSVEANVDTGVSMEQQPENFQDTVKEMPREEQQPVEEAPREESADVEAPKADAAEPERTETVEKPRVEKDAPEVEVKTETDDEPRSEAAETRQPVFHDVKSTPVKVGETYRTVDTEEPEMEQNLAETIQAAVEAGAQKVEIRLAPQNLGSLVIEMTKDAGGALQVVLHASNARAAGVLNQHMDGLQAALRSYSQDEVRIEVQRSDESQEQHFKQADPDGRGNQNRQQQQERHEDEHAGEAFMQKLRLGLFGTDGI